MERKINAYDPETGKFIQTYKSISEAARTIFGKNNYKTKAYKILCCCKKRSNTVGQIINGKKYWYGFEYTGNQSRYPISFSKVGMRGHEEGVINGNKNIALYNAETGDKLKVYDSVCQAAKELKCNVSQIVRCCKHKTRTVKGYGLEYNGNDSRYPLGEKRGTEIKVDLLKDGVVVNTYNSMRVAAAFLGVSVALISYSISHKGHKIGEYTLEKHI